MGEGKHTYTHAIAMTNLAAGATPLVFMHSAHPTTTPCLILHNPTTIALFGLIVGLSIVMVTQITLGKVKETS